MFYRQGLREKSSNLSHSAADSNPGQPMPETEILSLLSGLPSSLWQELPAHLGPAQKRGQAAEAHWLSLAQTNKSSFQQLVI